MKKLIYIFPLLFFAFRVSAIIDIRDRVWLISSVSGDNEIVSETLTSIENAAKAERWNEAVECSEALRAQKGLNDYYLTNGELLPLTLEVMEIFYKYGKDIKNPKIPKELKPILKNYSEVAKGKQWYAYKYALIFLEAYYRKNHFTNDTVRAMLNIVNYDVYDKYQLERLLGYAKEYPERADDIHKFWEGLDNLDVKSNAETQLVYIFETALPIARKFELLETWFKENSLAIYRVMQNALAKSSAFITEEYPEKKKAYSEILRLLVLRQPPVSERLPVIALIKNTLSNPEFACTKTLPRKEEFTAENLEKILSTNGSEWENMCESVAFIWSDHADQRYKGNLSLEQTISALNKTGKLKEKIQNPDDDLSDIGEYVDLLKIPDVAGQLYNLAEKLFWAGQYKKARICFEFLISDDNKDAFGVGASHFFLGRMAKELPISIMQFSNFEERQNYALEHLLKVNTYATCLTYISYSYIMAAEIFHERGQDFPAIALLLIDVPSIDWNSVKVLRHTAAARYCYNLLDFTNQTRHVQEALRYCKAEDPEYQTLEEYRAKINPKLWTYCADKLFTNDDRTKAIVAALDDEQAQAWHPELFTALLHVWPKPPELPEGIATNRILNNNVFQFKIDEKLSDIIKRKKTDE